MNPRDRPLWYEGRGRYRRAAGPRRGRRLVWAHRAAAPRRRSNDPAVNSPGEWARGLQGTVPQERPREQQGAADGRCCSRMGGPEESVMWKPAAAVIIVTMAGATAHAQQQQSAIETLGKTMSDLAKEGYEIKAAEDLSGDLPKFVLQKAESIVICQINFSDGDESCFQLRSRGR
jgi:hypothetical protein